jgi:hypothetical protein
MDAIKSYVTKLCLWAFKLFFLLLIFLEKVRNLSPCLTSLRQVVACRGQRIETCQAGIMLYILDRLAAMQHRSVLYSRGQRVPYSGRKCHQEPGEGLTITCKKRRGVKAEQTGESEKVDTRWQQTTWRRSVTWLSTGAKNGHFKFAKMLNKTNESLKK